MIGEEDGEEDEDEWFIEQNVNSIEDEIKLPSNIKYGFAQTKSNIFRRLGVIGFNI